MYYGQNHENVVNRAPVSTTFWGTVVGQTKTEYITAPSRVLENPVTNTELTPFGTFYHHPIEGGYDALHGAMMHVPQTDLSYSGENAHWRSPGVVGFSSAGEVQRAILNPTTSARTGFSMLPSVVPPTFFRAPPSQTTQAVPIMAVGV